MSYLYVNVIIEKVAVIYQTKATTITAQSYSLLLFQYINQTKHSVYKERCILH